MLIRKPDKAIQVKAKRAGLLTMICESGFPDVGFERLVIVAPGTKIPWGLLEYGFHFLTRWDAAAPLWRYGGVAGKVGTKAERAATKEVSLDLRVLLCAPELLFVRGDGDGLALLKTWQAEIERFPNAEPRLAFLRAHCLVKPRLCTLPRGWLMELPVRPPSRGASRRKGGRRKRGRPLIRVEVTPGRFVRCHPEDAEKVKKMHQQGRRSH